MSKGWKIFWWIFVIILIILIVIGIFQYYKWKGIWEKIHFSKPIPTALNLQGLTLADILSAAFTGTQKDITATLAMSITNDSDTDITFNNMKVKLLYNGSLISETSETLANTNFVLKAHDTLQVSDTINIRLNTAGDFLKEKVLGGHPSVDYTVDLSVYGIPVGKIYPIEGSFTW